MFYFDLSDKYTVRDERSKWTLHYFNDSLIHSGIIDCAFMHFLAYILQKILNNLIKV